MVENQGEVYIKGTLKSFIISVSPFEKCFFLNQAFLEERTDYWRRVIEQW